MTLPTPIRPRPAVPRTSNPRAALAVLVLPALVLAACSRGDALDTHAAAEPFDEPVVIENCDEEITFEAPPQRIVTMNAHVTETLIRMGVGDRIVGMGYGDREPLPEVADEWEQIPSLAEEYPTWEQIMDLDPDLVVGGMRSAFDEKEGRSRDAFAEADIGTFLFSEYCGEGFPDVSILEEDFAELGRFLAVEEAAGEHTDRITGDLDAVRAALDEAGVADVPTFFYDSGESEPMTVGGVGVGQLIADYAGAENLYAEGDRPYPTASWEVIGERAPEAIVVLDYGENSAEEKIEYLRQQPIMATTSAVRDDRFVVVPLADFFQSERMVDSVEAIAHALHPQVFEDRTP